MGDTDLDKTDKPAPKAGNTLEEARQEAARRRREGGTRLAARKRRRRHRRALYSGIAAALLLALLGTGAYDIYNNLNAAISGVETESGELPEEYKSSEEEQLQGIVNFLVCGIDYSDEDDTAGGQSNANSYSGKDSVGNTDMILYVRYDTTNNDVTIMQLPRDIYVGEERETGGYGKINSLYKYATDTENRMAALVEVIYEQLHLPVDFYVTLDMDAVKEIIDIKGSLRVYVPIDVDNPETGDIIPAGWRHFSGDEAEYFLRNRYSSTYGGQGDVMRLQMQQYFYSALFREFKELAPQDLVMWLGVLLYRAKTDMDVLKLGTLAQHALELQGADITFIRPSIGGALHNGQSVVILIPEDMATLLNTYFRAPGERYSADQLNIPTLEIEEDIGIYEANVRSMGDILQEEVAFDALQETEEDAVPDETQE